MYHGGVRWWRRHWLLICLPCVRRTSFSSSSNFKLCSILIKSLLLQVTIVFCVGFNFLSNKHEQRNTCKSSYLCVHFFTNKQLTQQFNVSTCMDSVCANEPVLSCWFFNRLLLFPLQPTWNDQEYTQECRWT